MEKSRLLLALSLLTAVLVATASVRAQDSPLPEHPLMRHVSGPQDFKWMMEAHAQLRVPKLAWAMLQADRKLPREQQIFPLVEDWMFDKFIAHGSETLHDRSKWMNDPEFLKYHNLVGKMPLNEQLYYYLFGKFLPEMTGKRAKRAVGVIRKVDRTDEAERMNTFREMNERAPMLNRNGTLNETAQQIWALEAAPDATDRAEDPRTVDEFGKKLKPSPEFIESLPEDHKLFKGKMSKALMLEACRRATAEYWNVITESDSFESYKLRKLREQGRMTEYRAYRCFVDGFRVKLQKLGIFR